MSVSPPAAPPRRTRRAPAPFARFTRQRDPDLREPGSEPAIREGDAAAQVADRERRYRLALLTADLFAACLALLLAGAIGGDEFSPLVLLGLPVVVLGSKLSGLYDRDPIVINKTTIDEAPGLFQLAAIYTLIVWLFSGIVLDGTMEPVQAISLWMALWVFTVVFRRVARMVARRGGKTERLLLVGDAATYARLSEKLELSMVNARLVGRMSLQRVSDRTQDERPVDEATLSALLGDLDVHRVVVVPSQTNPQVTLDLVRAVKALGVRVSIVPHVLDVVGNSVVFDDIGGMTLLGVRSFRLPRTSRLIKRGFDLVGASVGLVLAAPMLAAIALAIKLDSPGPVFFRQERIGRGGRPFRIFKFRTMVADAEARKAELLAHSDADGLFKMADDPRITRAGRFLRRTSLDELPQLINVIRAEMSLVGPRPLIASEDRTITGHDRNRLHLTPGMTGHWQIMGSSRVPMHEMVKIDYVYVTHWSLFEDFKILVRTIPYMLSRRGM